MKEETFMGPDSFPILPDGSCLRQHSLELGDLYCCFSFGNHGDCKQAFYLGSARQSGRKFGLLYGMEQYPGVCALCAFVMVAVLMRVYHDVFFMAFPEEGLDMNEEVMRMFMPDKTAFTHHETSSAGSWELAHNRSCT